MKYKIYQVYELGLHKLINLKEKKDVSDIHCVLPNGKIFDIERNTIVNSKYFKIELINLREENYIMTNYERMMNFTIEEMAQEIKAIANWNRKEKSKAEKDEDFYVKWLSTETPDDKCKVMGTDYCKNECPIGKEAREKEEGYTPSRIDVDKLNKIAEEHGLYGNKVTDYLPRK